MRLWVKTKKISKQKSKRAIVWHLKNLSKNINTKEIGVNVDGKLVRVVLEE